MPEGAVEAEAAAADPTLGPLDRKKEDDGDGRGLRPAPSGTLLIMKTAKKIYESDDQGVVHVDVPVGRSGQRVEVLVVWDDVGEANDRDERRMDDLVGLLKDVDLERPPQKAIALDPTARRSRLSRYATWTEEDMREFESALTAQRVVDAKLWS